MDNPEYIEVNDHKYKINSDYRTVFRYDKMMKDADISGYEKVMGALLLFYGKEGIKYPEDAESLLNGVITFCKGRPSAITGKTIKSSKEIDMDYNKDFGLIMSSMKSEYGIDILNEQIHWWTFYDYLNGLSSECALNAVREIRRRDLSSEKDAKERNRLKELKDLYSLDTKRPMSKEQKDSVETFYKLTGIERK